MVASPGNTLYTNAVTLTVPEDNLIACVLNLIESALCAELV